MHDESRGRSFATSETAGQVGVRRELVALVDHVLGRRGRQRRGVLLEGRAEGDATSNHAPIASPRPDAAWPLKPVPEAATESLRVVSMSPTGPIGVGDGLRRLVELAELEADGHGSPFRWSGVLPRPPSRNTGFVIPLQGKYGSAARIHKHQGDKGEVDMPSYDYEVDLQSLGAAAQGLNESIQLMKDNDVEDLVPSEDDLGSSVVWDAVDEFKSRWEEGLNNLMHDVEEMAGRVGKIAMNYYETDQSGFESLTRSPAGRGRAGHALMPDFAIAATPGAIRTKAATTTGKGQLFFDTGDALGKIDGRGVDRPGRRPLPRRARPRARPLGQGRQRLPARRQRAERLRRRRGERQATARWAADEYARGEQVSQDARSAYDADISRARDQAANAAAAGQVMTLTIIPFDDPGQADPRQRGARVRDREVDAGRRRPHLRRTRYAAAATTPPRNRAGSSPDCGSSEACWRAPARPCGTWPR